MMRCKRCIAIAAAFAAVGTATGCSSTGSSLPSLAPPSPEAAAASAPTPTDTAETGGISGATTALQAILTPQDLVVGTPTEVYTRVARGVLTCWFGADGPLKARFIYHAEAEPASQGGRSEIKIMTRDTTADDPRSLRAYRVLIQPTGGKTKIEVENTRLPEPLALRLKSDVERWSRDEPGCGEGPVTAGWDANAGAPSSDAKPKKR